MNETYHLDELPMKALLQNVIYAIKRGFGFIADSHKEETAAALISGYSTSFDGDWDIPLERKPVGILYADIAEYSRLTEQDEEGTHYRVVEALKVMMSHIAANDGRIANIAGDAILAEFRDVDRALHCAINVQLAARQWNADLALEQQLRFRIGVNFGEVIADQGDIYGKAVNLAARLEGLACSGGICISEMVRAKLEDESAFRFVAMGKQYVKNINEPVQAFWIEIDTEKIAAADLASATGVSAVA